MVFESLPNGHEGDITSALFNSRFTFNSSISFRPKWSWSDSHTYPSNKKNPSINACVFARFSYIGYIIVLKQWIMLVRYFLISAKKLIASSIGEFWQCILGSEMWNGIDYGRYWYHQATFAYSNIIHFEGWTILTLDFILKTILRPKTRPLSIGRMIFSIGTTVIIKAKSGAAIITAVAQGSHSKRFSRFYIRFNSKHKLTFQPKTCLL